MSGLAAVRRRLARLEGTKRGARVYFLDPETLAAERARILDQAERETAAGYDVRIVDFLDAEADEDREAGQ